MHELAEGENHPNLNLSKAKEFPLQLHPLSEHAKTVRRVKARHIAARARMEKLTEAALTKAFRSNEMASTLLARIAASYPDKTKQKSAMKERR